MKHKRLRWRQDMLFGYRSEIMDTLSDGSPVCLTHAVIVPIRGLYIKGLGQVCKASYKTVIQSNYDRYRRFEKSCTSLASAKVFASEEMRFIVEEMHRVCDIKIVEKKYLIINGEAIR